MKQDTLTRYISCHSGFGYYNWIDHRMIIAFSIVLWASLLTPWAQYLAASCNHAGGSLVSAAQIEELVPNQRHDQLAATDLQFQQLGQLELESDAPAARDLTMAATSIIAASKSKLALESSRISSEHSSTNKVSNTDAPNLHIQGESQFQINAREQAHSYGWLDWIMSGRLGLGSAKHHQQQQPLGANGLSYKENDAKDSSSAILDISQYDNEVVLRFGWHTDKERASFLRAAYSLVLDIWRLDMHSADVRISSKRVRDFIRLLPRSMKDNQAYYTELIGDLPRAVFDTLTLSSANDQDTTKYGLSKTNYMSFADIQRYLASLTSQNDHKLTVDSIGQTHEGRPIPVVKFEQPSLTLAADVKKVILIVCGIHGREWASVAACLDIISGLASSSSSPDATSLDSPVASSLSSSWSIKTRRLNQDADQEMVTRHKVDSLVKQIRQVMGSVDIHLVPILNPDGYVYSWDGDRLWSKNRQPTTVSVCCGVDIDRVYDYHWARRTGSTPCSDSYEGTHSGDGLESQHLANYLDPGHLAGYVQLHSYSDDSLIQYVDLDAGDDRGRIDQNWDHYGSSMSKQIAQDVAFQTSVRTENLIFGRGDINGSIMGLLDQAGVPAVQICLPTSNGGYLTPRKKVDGIVHRLVHVLSAFCEVVASGTH